MRSRDYLRQPEGKGIKKIQSQDGVYILKNEYVKISGRFMIFNKQVEHLLHLSPSQLRAAWLSLMFHLVV